MIVRVAAASPMSGLTRRFRHVALGTALFVGSLSVPQWSLAEAANPAPAALAPSEVDEGVAKIVVNLLRQHHFSHPDVNDAMSEELFDEFFKRLDPDHVYFLQSDIDEFTPYRDILDDSLLRNGRMDFAFAVYARFMQRLSERVASAEKQLAAPFDFTKEEEVEFDRNEAKWAKTPAELDEIWRLRLKNQLLVLKLAEEEARQERAAEDKAAAAAPADQAAAPKKDDVVDTSVLPGGKARTAEERVLQRYTNFVRWMEEKDASDVMEMYLSTLTSLLDPHSTYWNNRTFDDFNIEMKLSFDGIGATLSSVDGYTMVVTIIPGGPAAGEGNLKPGDLVVAIGQGDDEPEDVVNLPLDKVVRKIRGKRGTAVTLVVQKSVDGVPSKVKINRGEVKLSEKEAKGEVHKVTQEDGTVRTLGVIKLPGFYADAQGMRTGDEDAKSATNDVRKILTKMIADDKIDGVVMDLRGNGGGFLFEAISLTGLFIKDGPVVQIRYPGTTEVRDDEDSLVFDLPLVVMVDRSTASASEIFAAAIQDYGRGIVVGDEHTHGKGTVQDVMDLKKMVFSLRRTNPGALKYTVAKYYRVNGGSTQNKGVIPDIAFPSFTDYMEIGEQYLPHAMLWDEIETAKIVPATQNVGRFLDTLRQKSIARRTADEHFKELDAVLAHYRERRDQKSVTLNWDKRLAQRADDETWAKRRDVLMKLGDDETDEEVDESANNAEGPAKNDDIYVEETVRILADLVHLSGATAAVANKETQPTKDVTP